MKPLELKTRSTRIVLGASAAALLLSVACATSAAPSESPSRNDPAPLVRNVEAPKPGDAAAANQPDPAVTTVSPSEGNQSGPAMTSQLPSAEPTSAVTAEQPVEVTAEASVETEMQPVAETVPVGNNVGERIPDFSMRLLDGSRVTSADLRAQEQPAFLFFFETW